MAARSGEVGPGIIIREVERPQKRMGYAAIEFADALLASLEPATPRCAIMPSPLVSIGMPVYNGAEYLRDAIDSILAQTWEHWELIISDNASTDATPQICEAYALRDPRIQYHHNRSNLGAHPNYNRTFHLSRGKYFKWAPHDDLLHVDYLAECVAALESAPECVLCQTYLMYIDADGHQLGVYDSDLSGSDSHSVATRFGAIVLRPHPAYEVMGLFRRRVLEGSLLLESFHGADRALLAELALRGPFAQVTRPLLLVRDHAARYSRAQVRPRERAVWHDARNRGHISLPTWRLYHEYVRMIPRNVDRFRQRMACRSKLIAWWFTNWNSVRIAVDVLALAAPRTLSLAERVKHTFISPSPGPDQVRAKDPPK